MTSGRTRARVLTRVLLFATGLVFTAGLCSAQDRADIVQLRDGTVVEGLLIEYSPGGYLLLKSEGERLMHIAAADLLGVEHGAGEALGDEHEEIVLLRSGLIFRGRIRQEAPGRFVIIELPDAPVQVEIPYDDVWKILRRPVPLADDPASAQSVKSETVTLTLEITLGGRQVTRSDDPTASNNVTERLADEFAEVERARTEREAVACEQRRDDDQAEIQSSAETLDEAIAELARLAAICEDGPTRRKGDTSPTTPADLIALGPSGYEEWDLADVSTQARANASALAIRAASPAGDPTTLLALRNRIDARAQVTQIIAPRAGTNPQQLARIRQAAAELPPPDRGLLYSANRRHDQLLGIGLNSIPVLNLGSWRQGDYAGAAANMAFIAAGAAIMWAGFEYADHFEPVVTDAGVFRLPAPMTTVYIGTAVMGAAYVSSLIRPIWYDARCNRLLADALGVRP